MITDWRDLRHFEEIMRETLENLKMFNVTSLATLQNISPNLFSCNIQKQPSEVFCKKDVLRNFTKFTGKYLCHSLFFNKVAGLRPATLFKKKGPGTGVSCEFFEISKNIFSYRTPSVAASVYNNTFFTEHLQWLLLSLLMFVLLIE